MFSLTYDIFAELRDAADEDAEEGCDGEACQGGSHDLYRRCPDAEQTV